MPVSGLDVKFRRPLADGRSWGDIGPYEEIRGTLRFSIDPDNRCQHASHGRWPHGERQRR